MKKIAKSQQIQKSDGTTGIHGVRLALVFLALLLAMFTSSISETIAATALPTIVGDLGGVELIQWISTAYVLAATIMMPIYGKLGDLIGRKFLLIGALTIYTIGKIICGVAPDMGVLIAGRVISGLGGGGIMVLVSAIIADLVPARQRGKYLGVTGSVFAVSVVLGPLLGGFFVQVTGWRWLFAFTVPLTVIAVLALAKFLKEPPRKEKPKNLLDVPGIMLMSIWVTALVLAVSWGGNLYAWDSPTIIGLFTAFLVGAVLFAIREFHAARPVVDLSMFKDRNFALCTIAGLIMNISLMGVVNYLPTFYQIARDYTPEEAGLLMAPMMAGVLITGIIMGFVASKTGRYKWMPIMMFVGATIGVILLAHMTVATPLPLLLLYEFIAGVGVGFGLQILTLIIQNEFPHAVVGTATATSKFFQEIGATLGTAFIGSLFTSRLMTDLAGKLGSDASGLSIDKLTPSLVQHLPTEVQSVIANGYAEALLPLFYYFVPLLVLGFVLMWFLKEKPLAKKVN